MLQIKRGWFDRYYLLCMVPVVLLVLFYNFNAQGMSGLLVGYKAFAQVIHAGFDITVTDYYPLTFPMWGYGFLMAFSENHLVLLLIQLILAFISVYCFVNTLERYALLSSQSLLFFKGMLLISIPWYAFHTVRWPYSIASSLLIISLSLLYRGIREKYWVVSIILSGLSFGVLLNFRSDYILMPVVLVAIIFMIQRSRVNLKKNIVWILLIYSCLIPWALFTKKVCDHYLLTSTNGGHVALSGIGQYPNNIWGYTCDDACPKIHKHVEDVFGRGSSTWDYQGDQLLKKIFFTTVVSYPIEYLKKLYFCFLNMLQAGLYQGEFFEHDKSNSFFDKSNREVILSVYSDNFVSIKNVLPVFLQRFSYVFGKYLLILNVLLIPLLAYTVRTRKNLFVTLVAGVFLYQICLNIFLQCLSGYTSNIFLLLLVIPFLIKEMD